MSDGIDDPYPFESDDDLEIGELDLESVDAFDDERITVGELVGETESWRFGHVIVDEAQDLSPMEWRMIMRRVAGRSLTIVGDLAQQSVGRSDGAGWVVESWADRLPSELADIDRRDLTINYRSPSEVHVLAAQVLASFAPSVDPSQPIRSSGVDPTFVRLDDPEMVLAEVDRSVAELLGEVAGQIAVIGAGSNADDDVDPRVRWLDAGETKGLEFDAVVVVDPAAILDGHAGGPLLYIALTRATQRLVVIHHGELPSVLTPKA